MFRSRMSSHALFDNETLSLLTIINNEQNGTIAITFVNTNAKLEHLLVDIQHHAPQASWDLCAFC